MKWREKYNVDDADDQFKLSDPYGRDCNAEGCIEQLLRATKGLDLDPQDRQHASSGFRYIETVDPTTGQLRRYTRQLYRPVERDPKYGQWVVDSELLSTPIDKRTTRYGVTWDDISTREDREHWVAGGSLRVIDLQNNEVIAERVGYMMDRGLGSRAGFRRPWLMAERAACPPFPEGRRGAESRKFINQVLQPSKGE
jgi:hypothetical protein